MSLDLENDLMSQTNLFKIILMYGYLKWRQLNRQLKDKCKQSKITKPKSPK